MGKNVKIKQRSGPSMLRKGLTAIILVTCLVGTGYISYPFWHQYGYSAVASVQLDIGVPVKKVQPTSQSLEHTALVNKDFFNYLASQLRDTPYPGVDSYIQYTTARLGLKTFGMSVRPDFGPVLNDVASYKYSIEPSGFCRCSSDDRKSLAVVVISAPDHFSKRYVIRNTWRRHLAENFTVNATEVVGVAFVVGLPKSESAQQKIKRESERHRDILQVEMRDTYYNLTLKLAGLINWLQNKCSKVDYILKVDDDIYVNVRNLVAVIKSHDPSIPQVFGSGIMNPPLRTGKWGLGYEEWPWSEYPFYLSGAAILLTGSILSPLFAAIQVVPLFPFEDVYLTGLCLEKTNGTAMHSPRMLVKNTNLKYQIQDSVTWLTDSASQMFKLHMAANSFYKKKTICNYSLPGTPSADELLVPTPCVIDFEFTPYIQEFYMHI